MKKTKISRKVLFETTKEKDDMVYDFKLALINWEKYHNKPNTNKLKQVLGIEDIVNVKIEIIDDAEKSDDLLRLYVYKTKHCNINSVKTKQFSHALQVSLGNDETRKNWVLAEEGFSAKVFPENKEMMIKLVEDIVLDIQMFYVYGYEKDFCDVMSRKIFSKEKVAYLLNKDEKSYLGNIEDAEYISFASFCRDSNEKIDFEKYKEFWEKFDKYLKKDVKTSTVQEKESRVIISKANIKFIAECHPKGGQLSVKKIEKYLMNLPVGKYVIVRTVKKPKKSVQCARIKNKFGMKKWKTGKIKIVPIKHRYTYRKMLPYVSIFEFEWRG